MQWPFFEVSKLAKLLSKQFRALESGQLDARLSRSWSGQLEIVFRGFLPIGQNNTPTQGTGVVFTNFFKLDQIRNNRKASYTQAANVSRCDYDGDGDGYGKQFVAGHDQHGYDDDDDDDESRRHDVWECTGNGKGSVPATDRTTADNRAQPIIAHDGRRPDAEVMHIIQIGQDHHNCCWI